MEPWITMTLLLVSSHLPTYVSAADNRTDNENESPHADTAVDELELPIRTKLMNEIFTKAEHLGNHSPPLYRDDAAIDVYFGLSISKIEANTRTEELTVTAWCKVYWDNDFLKWNRSEHGGIDWLYLPIDKMWVPDITLVNSAKGEKNQIISGMATLHSSGRIFGAYHHIFKVPCLFTLRDYPWDQYPCDMWFQSLGYSSRVLNIKPIMVKNKSASLDLKTYLGGFKEMDEWEVAQNITSEVNASKDEGTLLMYSRRKALKMTLVLRRRLSFQVLLMIVPSIIFSCMTCLMFLVPPTRPDRLAYGNSLFAAYMVFMLILASSMPPLAGAFPKLGLFYGFNILMIVAAIALSVVIIHISRKGATGEMLSECCRRVVLHKLGPILMVHTAYKPETSYLRELELRPLVLPAAAAAKGGSTNSTRVSQNTEMDVFQLHTLEAMEKIQRSLERLHFRSRPDVEAFKDGNAEEWMTLAKILDRLFFILFCLIAAVGFGLLFPWPQS